MNNFSLLLIPFSKTLKKKKVYTRPKYTYIGFLHASISLSLMLRENAVGRQMVTRKKILLKYISSIIATWCNSQNTFFSKLKYQAQISTKWVFRPKEHSLKIHIIVNFSGHYALNHVWSNYKWHWYFDRIAYCKGDNTVWWTYSGRHTPKTASRYVWEVCAIRILEANFFSYYPVFSL